MVQLITVVGGMVVATAAALDNGLGKDHAAMGWNSWELAGCDITEDLFRGAVDAMAAGGFKEAGYQYINLDDCWMATERDGNGDLQWGANFPTGHTLGDYVHSKGFKFGMYLSAGVKTCSLRDPTNRTAVGWGSYGHEEQDAVWIAKQGADYLKYDGVCAVPASPSGYNRSFQTLDWEQVVVSRMGIALNNTGRQIWYQYGSPYTWNRAGVPHWITNVNASAGGLNSYRSGFDMGDSFGLVGEQINGIVKYAITQCQGNVPCDGVDAWADADCLEIGNNLTKINYTQAATYFSWYAVANAPLIMSTNVDTMDPKIKSILQNPRVIAIQNDFAGRVGVPIQSPMVKGGQIGNVWAKPLSQSATNSSAGYEKTGVVAFMQGGYGGSNSVTVYWNDLGIDPSAEAQVHDVVAGKDVGVFKGSYTATLWSGSWSTLVKIVPKKAAADASE